MKVGDYVRTEYGIAKYISDKVTKYGVYYVVDKDIMTCNVEGWENCLSGSNEIVKSSPNIIDLIEVGDIVNDEKIIDIGCLTNGPEEGTKVIDYYIAPNTVYYLKNEDIKSIVTKEQFKNMEYEVK